MILSQGKAAARTGTQPNGTPVRPVGNVLEGVFSPVGREWIELNLDSRPPGPEEGSEKL